MILDKKVAVKWSNKTRKWYESKGYAFTFYGDYFMVNTEDLPPKSAIKVRVACDYCNKEFTKSYHSAQGTIVCGNCRYKHAGVIKKDKILETNSMSLEIDENGYCYMQIDNDNTIIFDYDDLDKIIYHKWFVTERGYVATNIKQEDGTFKQAYIQKIITGLPSDILVGYINKNKLDNRKENFTILGVDNEDGITEPITSNYIGVSYNKKVGKWYARIKKDGVTINLGYFTDELACANAYNYFAIELFDNPKLNDCPYMTLEEWMSYRDSRTSLEEIMRRIDRLK